MVDIFDEIEIPEIKTNIKSQKMAKEAKFFGYTPSSETIEKIRKPLVQKLLYPTTEFVTSALGAPGDVLSLVNELIAKPITKKITKEEGLPFEETLLGKIIPTSERLHKGIEEFAKEPLKPETIGEELLGTTAGFLGSILGLGTKGIGKTGKIPFTSKTMPGAVKTVLNAFAPAAAFVGTKRAELPPWMQASAAIGTSLLTHKLTNKSIRQVMSDLYSKSNELAKDVIMPSEGLMHRLDNLQDIMQKGIKTAPKSRINTLINEIKTKASGGAIPLEDLIQIRKDIIEVGKEFTKEQMKGSEKFFKPFRAVIDNTINDYRNPEFQQTFRQANSLFRGIKESQRMESWIKTHFKESALGLGGRFFAKMLSKTIGLKPEMALVGIKQYNFTRALMRNPGFRKAYKDLLKNAANENIKGTSRSLKNFNQYYDKLGIEEKESKKDIFDELD